MKRDLRLLALLPVASVGCVLLAIRDALDALIEAAELRYSAELNGDDE